MSNAPRVGAILAANGQNSHDQLAVGADRAFGWLSRDNRVRRACVRVTSHAYFERFIVGCIAVNSVVLALVDFSVVDDKLNPVSHGKRFEGGHVVDAYSRANHTVEVVEHVLTVIFTTECILKVVALGFTGKGSYSRDPWNVIDLIMLFSSFVAEIPDMPNISELRAIRVLRPLRSMSAFPGMRRLVAALLNSLPALRNVVGLQMFVFVVFGILGVQLFGGRMSRVCRLTEFPVRLPVDATWPVPNDYLEQVLANASAFRCLDAPLLDYTDSTPGYSKETSPWRIPQDCFWPVHYSDGLLCADPYHAGGHHCPAGDTCGSNYDAFGNPRFVNERAMQDALHTERLNWGYTTYDNIGRALLTIFQSVTEEGWTLVMYMTMDASHPIVGACFAVSLIIFASYFVMNLTIAVISDEFQSDKPGRRATMSRLSLTWSARRLTADAGAQFEPRSPLYRLVTHKYFSEFITVAILANTVVLSLDHYPMSHSMDANLELAHFVLLCVFVVEMLLKLAGLGFRQYLRDKFNVFDAVIVLADLIEAAIIPPLFLGSSHKTSQTGSISLFRAFRLFRVFELARNWKSLRNLLQMIAQTVASIGNFGVLLFLFVYVFALMGMQFFGNTMRFDKFGYPTPHNVDEFWNGTVPRSNFDTLPWAIATVFQIITRDSWSTVLYDAMRGNDMAASLYFIVLTASKLQQKGSYQTTTKRKPAP
ncbi:hypothetical protein PF002_g25223 [Phytophthora fragariae]|uniref:Ion transport domain-containing protein n=1 Tax=Phytophthora fragariae TaxID=53985 RepID=A0A6A3WPH2_9STRA|nr:hypothetical protein PF002_g25223 [Phytophthora fragariae]